ncbi:hypothetical protein GCM10009771_16330 [Nesterenkonia flava]
MKTVNGRIGVDAHGNEAKNVAQFAQETGRSAGVVSDVPFAHATPASWGAHVASRGSNHEIAEQMIYGDLDVIIGAGHPLFDENSQPRTANWQWMTEGQYTDLQSGNTGFTFVETSEEIEAVADGIDVPERFFGLAPAATTLQYNRDSLAQAEARRGSGRTDGEPLTADQQLAPFEADRNDIVSLPDMTRAGLNVLSQNDEGFFLMVEAGAVDWAGHANATTGTIEEMIAFNDSVEVVNDWVEQNSSWDETLVIVTADHETGYLEGPHGEPQWTSMSGTAGELPTDGWYSGDHTNHLVPLFARGAGAELFYDYIKGTDPVRGAYVDNIDVALMNFELWGEDAEARDSDGIPLDVTIPELGDPGTGPGSLVISIAQNNGVELTGGHNIGDARRYLGVLPTISVTDSRAPAQAGGENGGWTVSGQSSRLESGTNVLAPGYLGWSPALANNSREGVTEGAPVRTLLRGGVGLAQPQTLGSAVGDNRLGTTGLTAEVALEAPVDAPAGDYEGELTVSLFPVD